MNTSSPSPIEHDQKQLAASGFPVEVLEEYCGCNLFLVGHPDFLVMVKPSG